MENTETEQDRKRPGPRPNPALAALEKYTMKLDPEDAEWGKAQPGGLSDLVRRLLHQARLEGGKK
jgi:hypothetical protein